MPKDACLGVLAYRGHEVYFKTQSRQVEGDISGTAYTVLPFEEIQYFNSCFGGLSADMTNPVGVQD